MNPEVGRQSEGNIVADRNPKSEIRNPKQIPIKRKSKTQNGAASRRRGAPNAWISQRALVLDFEDSKFEFVSDLGFRISDLVNGLGPEARCVQLWFG